MQDLTKLSSKDLLDDYKLFILKISSEFFKEEPHSVLRIKLFDAEKELERRLNYYDQYMEMIKKIEQKILYGQEQLKANPDFDSSKVCED